MVKSTTVGSGKLTATKSPIVEQKRKNRRTFILKTAAQLFAEHSYQRTTMDMLSDATQLNKGTLYYYYTSKPDILYDICVDTTDKHFRVVSAAAKMSNAIEALDFIIETSIHYIIENRDYCRVYFQENQFFEQIFSRNQYRKVRQQQGDFMKNLYAVLQNGVDNGQIRPVDIRNCGRLIYATILGPYRWRERNLNSEIIIAEARGLILEGLKKR